MVYKLKPLELGLEFEDRDYELGDTINIQISLTPNGDVNLRGAALTSCARNATAKGEQR